MLQSLNELFCFAGPIALIIQIALCVHVYRTGRPFWWIVIILIGSLVGCILYVILEILPEVGRHGSRLTGGSWFIPKSVLVRRAQERLADSDTVANRLGLAELLYYSGKKDEAEQIVAGCASGVFQDDADVIANVAWYKLAVGKLAEAEQLIAQADASNNRFAGQRLALLKARILLGYQKYAEAKAAFSGLQSAHLGEEPRYYLAVCHWKLGERKEALAILNNILTSYRRGSAIWRRAEKDWYQAARDMVGEINRTA